VIARFKGTPPKLAEAQYLIAKELRLDSEAGPMLIAARSGRADVVALLLELVMITDVADATQLRGLQAAVAGGSIDVVLRNSRQWSTRSISGSVSHPCSACQTMRMKRSKWRNSYWLTARMPGSGTRVESHPMKPPANASWPMPPI
jgi:hypothetical protein